MCITKIRLGDFYNSFKTFRETIKKPLQISLACFVKLKKLYPLTKIQTPAENKYNHGVSLKQTCIAAYRKFKTWQYNVITMCYYIYFINIYICWCIKQEMTQYIFKQSMCDFKGRIRIKISLPYRMAKSTKFLGLLLDTLKAEVLPPHPGTQRSLYAGTWHTTSDR